MTKPNVIAFAYTDYGGDFMDKVAIEYFLENHPKNIVVENTGYNGKNAIVWGKVAMDWVEATEKNPMGFEDFESFFYEKFFEEEEKSFNEYLEELKDEGYYYNTGEVMEWLRNNKSGNYSNGYEIEDMTTSGLDFNSDDLTQELLAKGLIEKSEEYAKGGNINSKTNKKMATKKVKDGQAAPQTKRWIFAFNKGGYNYYNTKEVPYKKPVDSEKKGAPVGYRFSKFAEEKGITNNRFRKPTKSEVEQYAGKKKNGKLIMYRETRSNKSDVNPKKRI